MHRWLGASLVASALLHAALGWQLGSAPRERPAPPERDTFRVRMVEVPPPASPRAESPAPEPEPPAPEPLEPSPRPTPPRPKPAPSKPPTPEPEPVPSALEREPAPPAEESAAHEPSAEPAPSPEALGSAPPALLTEAAGAGPGVVLRAGVTGDGVAHAGGTRAPGPRASELAPTFRAPPLAKLSDLSRKPRAPSLDAALRENYPADLRRRGMEGQAEVRVMIDARGRVAEVSVLSESASGFAQACRRTLMGSRWSEPLDRDGRPVGTRLTYRCRFQIER